MYGKRWMNEIKNFYPSFWAVIPFSFEKGDYSLIVLNYYYFFQVIFVRFLPFLYLFKIILRFFMQSVCSYIFAIFCCWCFLLRKKVFFLSHLVYLSYAQPPVYPAGTVQQHDKWRARQKAVNLFAHARTLNSLKSGVVLLQHRGSK